MVEVSTHASVRRRPARLARRGGRGSFNSRLREEATAITPSRRWRRPRFNSRLREEATLHGSDDHLHRGRFNSRLREEATFFGAHLPHKTGQFQLTPP